MTGEEKPKRGAKSKHQSGPNQVDTISRSFAGRDIDLQLVNELPAEVDPCGENGEFHTFTYAGPMFSKAIPIASGEIVERDGFVFADVL